MATGSLNSVPSSIVTLPEINAVCCIPELPGLLPSGFGFIPPLVCGLVREPNRPWAKSAADEINRNKTERRRRRCITHPRKLFRALYFSKPKSSEEKVRG